MLKRAALAEEDRNLRRQQELAPRAREEGNRSLYIQKSANVPNITSSFSKIYAHLHLHLCPLNPSIALLLIPDCSPQLIYLNGKMPTPKTATLLTILAFSGEVKVLYALEKYPLGAGRRGSAFWTTMRCCLGAIISYVLIVRSRCNGWSLWWFFENLLNL